MQKLSEIGILELPLIIGDIIFLVAEDLYLLEVVGLAQWTVFVFALALLFAALGVRFFAVLRNRLDLQHIIMQ